MSSASKIIIWPNTHFMLLNITWNDPNHKRMVPSTHPPLMICFWDNFSSISSVIMWLPNQKGWRWKCRQEFFTPYVKKADEQSVDKIPAGGTSSHQVSGPPRDFSSYILPLNLQLSRHLSFIFDPITNRKSTVLLNKYYKYWWFANFVIIMKLVSSKNHSGNTQQ